MGRGGGVSGEKKKSCLLPVPVVDLLGDILGELCWLFLVSLDPGWLKGRGESGDVTDVGGFPFFCV